MSVEIGTKPSPAWTILPEAADETVILPDSYLVDLGKTEKESSAPLPDRKHLRSGTHPRKRTKAKVRLSVKKESGLTDDSLDGNPLYGTTLE